MTVALPQSLVWWVCCYQCAPSHRDAPGKLLRFGGLGWTEQQATEQAVAWLHAHGDVIGHTCMTMSTTGVLTGDHPAPRIGTAVVGTPGAHEVVALFERLAAGPQTGVHTVVARGLRLTPLNEHGRPTGTPLELGAEGWRPVDS